MPPKKLLDRVRDAIRLKHYSIRTEQAYVDWIRRYILFHGKRHPQTMDSSEIETFLTHLAVDRNVAAPTQNQALSALLFLYRNVLKKDIGPVDAVRAKKPKRLPTVLTENEALQVGAGADPGHLPALSATQIQLRNLTLTSLSLISLPASGTPREALPRPCCPILDRSTAMWFVPKPPAVPLKGPISLNRHRGGSNTLQSAPGKTS